MAFMKYSSHFGQSLALSTPVLNLLASEQAVGQSRVLWLMAQQT